MDSFARRLRAGGTVIAALAANYSFVALYNDGPQHILRVVSFLVNQTGSASAVASITQGTVGTLVSRGIPIFQGGADAAGVIYSGQNTTAPPFGVNLNLLGGAISNPPYQTWFYIRPGGTLLVKNDTVNISLGCSLWWEVLSMELLSPDEIA